MQLSLVTLCLILAIFSFAVVAGFILLKDNVQQISARLLAAFLLSMVLALINFLIVSSGFVNQALWIAFIGNTLGLAAAPLLFLYAKSLVEIDFRLGAKSAMYFAPVGIFFSIVVAAYTAQPLSTKYQILHDPNFPSVINSPVLPIAIFAYVLFFLISTLHALFRHKGQFRNHYSSKDLGELSWLRISVVGALVVWVSSIVHEIAIAVWPYRWLDRSFVQLHAITAFVFGLYFLIHALRLSAHPLRPTPLENAEIDKYGGHRLSDEQMTEFAAAIENHLSKSAAHLRSALSIDELADALPMSARELSQTLNRHFNQSFFDYINTHRVETAMAQLSSDRNAQVSDIMHACGFSSKSSFYAAFRKVTGKTPSQFRSSSVDLAQANATDN